MKITTKINFYFFFVIITVIVISFTLLYISIKDYIKTDIDSRLKLILHTKSFDLKTYLKTIKLSVKQISKGPTIITFLKTDNNSKDKQSLFETVIKRLNDLKESNHNIYEILLVDASNKVVASTNPEYIGLSKIDDANFISGQRDVYIKDAYYLKDIDKQLISVSMPIIDSDSGDSLGLVVTRMELNEINNVLTENTNLLDEEEVYVVNRYGYMITPSKFIKNSFLKQKIDNVNFRNSRLYKDKQKFRKMDIYYSYLDKKVLGSYEYIPEMEWTVIGEIPENIAYKPLDKIWFVFTVMLFLMSILAFFLGRIISKIISEPILKLHRGIEVIGEGNLDYKISIDSKDEIGELAREFDNMTGALKSTTTSIALLYKEIDERKKLEREILNANKKLEELHIRESNFVKNVSHEFKNPLCVVNGYLSLMLNQPNNELNEGQRKRVEIVKRNIDRLIRLVIDLLDVAKIEAGKFELKLEQIDIMALTNEILENHNIEFLDSNININKNILKDINLFYGDRDKLIEVLDNILNNAIKFTPKGGSIGLKIEEFEKEIRFEISDFGPGIPKEQQEKIFEKFERIVTHGKEGTGLGLSIAKGIVEVHKGKIWVESEEGKGSTFIFTISKELNI